MLTSAKIASTKNGVLIQEKVLLNAFHFGDLERFGNRFATLGTKVVMLQTEGTRQNVALDQRAGATSQNLSPTS